MIRVNGDPESAGILRCTRLEEAEANHAMVLAALDRERRAIGEIQRSLLPESLPEIPGFEMSSYYRPSERAGGDYFDVVPLIGGQWGIVMADVSGHGTPAAVIMAVMRTLIHATLPENRDKPSRKFLEWANHVMSSSYLRDGRFVTVWCAVLDPKSRRLTYASAGHNPARLLRDGAILELDGAGGFPLGIDSTTVYSEECIELAPHDLLVIYTDGITEAMRAGDDGRSLFGTERLDRILLGCELGRARDCTKQVVEALAAFTGGAAPTDDQTMLLVRAHGDASAGGSVSQNDVWYDAA